MSAVKQYIDLFKENRSLIDSHSAPVLNARRDEAMAALELSGFPTTDDEDYKRTDIEKAYEPDYGLNIGRVDVPVNPYEVFRCDVPNLSTQLYFLVNDVFYEKRIPDGLLPDGVIIGSLKKIALTHP